METILLIILVILTGATLTVVYLNLRSKPKDDKENKEAQEAIGASQQIALWRLPIQGILIWIAYWIRK